MKRHGFALLLACIAWSPAGGQTLATNFQLHSRLTLADLGVNPTTDAHVWSVVGWADAASHREFALVSSTLRTTFVEVTNPAAPRVLAYAADTHYAFAEASVVHDRLYVPDLPGQRVAHYDLRQLLTATGPPHVIPPTILATPPTALSSVAASDRLFVARSGALQAYDVSTPAAPRLVGELPLADVSRHTSVAYHGPDADYQGHEVVLATRPATGGGTKLSVIDFHDPSQAELVGESGRNPSPGIARGVTLTADHGYTLSADAFGGGLYVGDVRDLDAPSFVGRVTGHGWLGSVDDIEVRGAYAYVANNSSGLTVIDTRQAARGVSLLDDLGQFDMSSESTHSVYPHLPSGHVLVAQNGSLVVLSPFRAPADGNWDGHITGADFTIWADNFGQFAGDAEPSDGDYSGDGYVTGADFTIWADYFGRGALDDAPGGATSVPEPATWLLATTGLALVVGCRRRVRRSEIRALAIMAPTVIVVVASNHARAGGFTGLGFLTDQNASASFDISADGSTASGESYDSSGVDYEAFRWTQSQGIVSLGLAPGYGESHARGLSANGSVIVGGSALPGYQAFRWTEGSGLQSIGYLPGDTESAAYDTSDDGTVVVGNSRAVGVGTQAFRWTDAEGMHGIGFLPGKTSSTAYAISGDASTIVGMSYVSASSDARAYRWREGVGMTDLGLLPGLASSRAFGVSDDGSVVVGYGSDDGGSLAFRWTEDGGIQSLGTLPGMDRSAAYGVSADGSVVVGESTEITGSTATTRGFVWTQDFGMRSIEDVLSGLGLQDEIAGWRLVRASGVSADGRTIVGFGRNPQGQGEAWIATIPEPSTLGLLAVALGGVGWATLSGRVPRHRR